MNFFDPFKSTDYKYLNIDDLCMGPEPELIKKSQSQFLSQILNGQQNQIFPRTYNIPSTKAQIQKQNDVHRMEDNSGQSDSLYSKKSTSKSSPFHNFQKHLVITLRNLLTLQTLQGNFGESQKLARQIFVVFKKSQKTSRQFLEYIYGIFETDSFEDQQTLESSFKKGDLKSIFEDKSWDDIKKAQEILRQATKIELDHCDIDEFLKNRKIQKKKEFIEYLNLFKVELKSGKQRKKVYKTLKNRITNKIGKQQ